MAEGLLRDLAGDRCEVFSAGTEATHVRQEAISVMAEIGVDISDQESKTLELYLEGPFDHVVTVCDDANEACPFFPGASGCTGRSVIPRRPPVALTSAYRRFETCGMRSECVSRMC
jgi:protein-tyrosine-phosphatase